MSRPTASVDDIARRVLDAEAGGEGGAEAWASAAESACRKICERLEPLMGRSGCAAIVSRAIDLTRRGKPALGPVEPSSDLPQLLAGFKAALLKLDEEQAAATGTGVLANVIGLLVRLLGEELGMKPIRNSWPDVPICNEGRSTMETEG